jgi:hypothetical protein
MNSELAASTCTSGTSPRGTRSVGTQMTSRAAVRVSRSRLGLPEKVPTVGIATAVTSTR